MKKTTKKTILILGGMALVLSLIIMPMAKGEGQGSWGMEDYRPFGTGEGQGSWGMELPTYFNR